MRSIFFIILLLLGSIYSFSQTNWVTKEIGNNIVVQFPTNPEFNLRGKAGTYSSETPYNLFMVIVQYDVIPNYTEFLKLSQGEQAKFIEHFLDNTVKGMLSYFGNEGTPFQSIQVGKFRGREVAYRSVNPNTGEYVMKYTKIVSVYNKIYAFQCWCLTDETQCKKERDIFFNSISNK